MKKTTSTSTDPSISWTLNVKAESPDAMLEEIIKKQYETNKKLERIDEMIFILGCIVIVSAISILIFN